MAKVAKLVCFSLMTRVIVDENATEDEIIEACYPKIQDKIDNRELGDNLESIKEDIEIPLGTLFGDVYYQPELDENGYIKGHPKETIFPFEVWHNKEKLMELYPNCNPIEYHGDDIEYVQFMDVD
ncbi:MAG: hypothetical protein KatS3mg035_0997 [Bacteroidia bacterium]|nr:MAG: hypothetical protein KatS3mg035_0997 [Bacteroidia bacterium]